VSSYKFSDEFNTTPAFLPRVETLEHSSVPLRAIAGLGRSVRGLGVQGITVTHFIGAVLRGGLTYPATARTAWTRSLLNQVRFTAVQALPFLGTIALLIGMTVIVQANAQAVKFGFSDVLGRILTSVVVRELGPLLTAIVVLGRSGTAIAAELATSTVLGETDAMEAMGIDPLQYLVFPRVVGGAISVALLVVFFNAISLIGGALAAWVIGAVSLQEYLGSLRLALSLGDLVLMVGKGAVFGAGIATLCAYAGLMGGRTPPDIPKSVTHGVVLSLLFVVAVSALFTVIAYT
jgi:phospholipid/cholesterol/gamma-HCH transport system permease protein